MLTPTRFFQDETAYLPKQRGELDLMPYLKAICADYSTLFQQLDGSPLANLMQAKAGVAEQLATDLCLVIELFQSGKTFEAHSVFSGLMQARLVDLHGLFPRGDTNKQFEILYRARAGGNKLYSTEQMFHIPFSKRHKVAEQRYSIPGFPCLYLGGSIYICWEELNRPDLNLIQMAAFHLKPEPALSILDFGIPPHFLGFYIEQETKGRTPDIRLVTLVESYAALWPLIAACSIRVAHPDAAFKPEYIIPKLVLSWMVESAKEEFHALRYFSTKTETNYNNPLLGSNLVFPTKPPTRDEETEESCAWLRSMFQISGPISWQVAKTSPIKGAATKVPNADGEIEIIDGDPVCYQDTDFYRMQRQLLRLNVQTVT